MPERADRRARLVEVARVVGIHEHVAAGLDLVVDAGRRFDLEGAGAGAADDRAVQSLLAQLLHRATRSHRPRCRSACGAPPPSACAARCRGRPAGRRRSGASKRRCASPAPPHPGPGATPQRPAPTSISTSTGSRTPASAAAVSIAATCAASSAHTATLAMRASAASRASFDAPDHLVAHQDVRNAAPGQRLRLGHLLHALADRTARHLQLRDHRRFVRLGVRAQLRPGGRQQFGHVVEIASNASRSISSAGVSTSSSRMPGRAGGGCSMASDSPWPAMAGACRRARSRHGRQSCPSRSHDNPRQGDTRRPLGGEPSPAREPEHRPTHHAPARRDAAATSDNARREPLRAASHAASPAPNARADRPARRAKPACPHRAVCRRATAVSVSFRIGGDRR